MSTLDGSERQSDAQGAHGSSTAGGNGAGGGGGTSSSRHEHTSDRITPRLDRKKVGDINSYSVSRKRKNGAVSSVFANLAERSYNAIFLVFFTVQKIYIQSCIGALSFYNSKRSIGGSSFLSVISLECT